MKIRFLLAILFCSTVAFGQGTGEVIITEIHNRPLKPSQAQLDAASPNNPDDGTDSPNEGHTEWFEIYNTTSSPVVMDGWTLTDASSSSNVSTIGSFTLAANSYAVFAGFNIPDAQGGVIFDYFYDYKKPSFNNESSYSESDDDSCPDGVIIAKGDGTLVDEVRYDYGYGNYIGNSESGSCNTNTTTAGFPPQGGSSKFSFQLNYNPTIMNAAGNDVAANWSYSTVTYDSAGSQKGTPGSQNDGAVIVDNDGDTYFSDVDCDDDDPNVNPGETEILNNGIDDDCDPSTQDVDGSTCGIGVIITEIHNRPQKPSQAQVDAALPNNTGGDLTPNEGHTEWFEIYNTTDAPIVMDGWIIQDGSNGASSTITSFTLAANSYAVFAGFNIPDAQGGLVFDYFYDYKTPSFNNESSYDAVTDTNCPDGVRLSLADGTLVDEVLYDYGYGFYIGSTASCSDAAAAIGIPGQDSPSRTSFMLNCDPAVMNCVANDLAENWSFSTSVYDDNSDDADLGDQIGTPGQANDTDCISLVDNDGDTYFSDVDCDDNDPNVNPGETEILNNGIDDDCDPSTQDVDGSICGIGVIITEIHNRPQKPSQAQVDAALPNNTGGDLTPNEGHTEWFEIYNTTDAPIVMDGWIIQDGSNGASSTITSFTLAANSYAVFAGFNIPDAQGGLVFDYFYDYKTPSFNNESSYDAVTDTNCPDGVRLSLADGTLVDEVLYDYGYGFYIGSTASCSDAAAAIGIPGQDSPSRTSFMLNCDPAVMNCVANDLAENWSFSTSVYDDNSDDADLGDQIGTPGQANDAACAPPAPLCTAEVIITEIHNRPAKPTQAQVDAALPNNSGGDLTPNEGHTEWFEVYNTTSSPVVMDGWIIEDGSNSSASSTITSFTLAANSYAVFAGFNIPDAQGGIVFDYFYDYKAPSFNNESSYSEMTDTSCPDGVRLSKPDGTLVDEVLYDYGYGFYIGNAGSSSSCSSNAAAIGIPGQDSPSNTSFMLNPDPAVMNCIDNDLAENWSFSSTVYDDNSAEEEVSSQLGTPGSANIAATLGCTDPCSANYDATATEDDGTCTAQLLGCTDAEATNFDATALCDDNSCVFAISGCTDPCSANYDATATEDDGTCTAQLLGCTDAEATNFDATALCDDNSCVFAISGCTDPCSANYDATATEDDGTCTAQLLGCTDAEATNFDATALCDDNSCVFPVMGCTDPCSANYNPVAEEDDGSCSAQLLGCTDSGATNYDADALCDDDSCVFPVMGCTDPCSANYDADAEVDDGTCTAQLLGCTNSGATNYDADALCDDDSCVFPVMGCTDPCSANYDADAEVDDGTCTAQLLGCTNSGATNYDADALCDDDSCVFAVTGCTDPCSANYNPVAEEDDGSCSAQLLGCTDSGATNYDADALCDDDSCVFPVMGCTDPCSANYDADAEVDDGTCTAQLLGCTNSGATNYDADALCDDDSCEFAVTGCTDPCSANYNPVAEEDDGSCSAQLLGCTDSGATNYDADALCDDDSCEFAVTGCTDPCSANYNPDAEEDDGSCTAQLLGCTDSGATNYDADALCDDDSCEFAVTGCTDPCSANYNPVAEEDDGSCSAQLLGCTDSGATNYDADALCDDDSCEFAVTGCTDPCSANYNPDAEEDDGSCTAQLLGCTDSGATNYDADALCDDDSCEFVVTGCTDPCSANYNPDAEEDDGSCTELVMAATISTTDTTTICVGDDIPDPITVSVEGGAGANTAWVITDEDLTILALPEAGPFDLDGAGVGTCIIWLVNYEDLSGAMVGENAGDLTGCYALSNGITVTREECIVVETYDLFTILYLDLNGNGIQDNGEPGLANAQLTVTAVDGTVYNSSTGSNGEVTLSVTEEGEYSFSIILTGGLEFTDSGFSGTGTITISGDLSYLTDAFGGQDIGVMSTGDACTDFAATNASVCSTNDITYDVLLVFQGGDPGANGYNIVDNNSGVTISNYQDGTIILGPFSNGTGYSFTVSPTNHPECFLVFAESLVDCVTTAVELVSFTGNAKEEFNALNWVLGSEIENSAFIVERSYDGDSFEDIGLVTSRGNSNTLVSYSFNDATVRTGMAYYRLSAISILGKREVISTVISINRDSQELTLSIYPLPVDNQLNLSLDNNVVGEFDMAIYDISGKLIFTKKLNIIGVAQIDVSSLSNGIYFISLKNESHLLQQSFLKN